MPLSQLANEIIRLSEMHRSTPVLVTPVYLSLRKEFWVQLVETIGRKSKRNVRIDWYRNSSAHPLGLIADRWASHQAAWINRQLRNRAVSQSSPSQTPIGRVQITATIGKPGNVKGEMIVGLCDERMELSQWTTPIRLGGSPTRRADLQWA